MFYFWTLSYVLFNLPHLKQWPRHQALCCLTETERGRERARKAGVGDLLALPDTLPVIEDRVDLIVSGLSVLLLDQGVCQGRRPQLQTLCSCQDTVPCRHHVRLR